MLTLFFSPLIIKSTFMLDLVQLLYVSSLEKTQMHNYFKCLYFLEKVTENSLHY